MEKKWTNSDEMEVKISIKDFLMRICLKWRLMIVFAIIFMLLLDGVAVFKDYRQVQAFNTSQNVSAREKLEQKMQDGLDKVNEAKKELSDREIEEVERAAATYNNVLFCYNNLLEYSKQSIKMQLDPQRVPTIVLQYNVYNYYKVEYPVIEEKDRTSSILNAIGMSLDTDEICTEIANVIHYDGNDAYIRELITYDTAADNLIITLRGRSQDECQKMADVVKRHVEKKSIDLRKAFGKFDVTLLMESFDEYQSPELVLDYTNQVTALNNMKGAFNNSTSYLNEKQRAYYYALLDEKNIDKDSILNEENEIRLDSAPSIRYFHKKYSLLGFALGIILIGGIEALKYLFTKKIRIREDIKNHFEIDILGELKKEDAQKNSWMDGFIKRFFQGEERFSQEDQLRMVCSAIRISAQKNKWEKVFITSSLCDTEMDKVIDKIKKNIVKDVKNVTSGTAIMFDSEAFEKMADSQGVILVEELGKSRYKDVQEELIRCGSVGASVIGCVIVE